MLTFFYFYHDQCLTWSFSHSVSLSWLHFQRVSLQRILPALFKEAINPDMVPFLLPSILMVAEQSNETEYKLQILPQLVPLFKLKEPVQVEICVLIFIHIHIHIHIHMHTHLHILIQSSSHVVKSSLLVFPFILPCSCTFLLLV